MALKVVDPITYEEVPPKSEGLLFAKGPMVMQGYLGDEVRTEEKFGLMDCYCSTIVPAKGENFYKVVDVRFEGQIVCR